MRAIASGLWLKNEINGRLLIRWAVNDGLRCPYDQLFETSGEFELVEIPRMDHSIRASSQPTLIRTLKAKVKNKLQGIDHCFMDREISTRIRPGKLDIVKVARKYKTIYLQTCHDFGGDFSPYRQFKPVRQIQAQIDAVTARYTAATVGVHIRRTDHEMAKENSPLELYVERMQAEIAKDAATTFFLATDEPEVERMLQDVFGSRILTHTKENSRETVKGIQDAATDLFCLSRTRKLLGSYFSSFTDVASRLSGIELEVVKK